MIQKTTLQFLNQLATNNNRIWFEENRGKYELAKSNYMEFVSAVIGIIQKIDKNISDVSTKSCTFRINRDVRFSKNKDPFKPYFGMYLKMGGRKSIYPGYYIHLESNNKSFVGGGMWDPEPDIIYKIRQEISYQSKDFLKIIQSKKFKATFGDLILTDKYALKNLPKGFASDPKVDAYIKLKSWLATKPILDKELLGADCLEIIKDTCQVICPLFDFFITGLE